MDTQFYKEKGYVILKDFFDPKLVDEVRLDAQKIFISQMLRLGIVDTEDLSEEEFAQSMFEFYKKDKQCLFNCGKHVQHLVSLHRLSVHESVTKAIKDLGLIEPVISTRPLLLFNAEKLASSETYWKVPLHQDWYSMQGSLDSVVVWVPLIDIEKAIGPLDVFPGTHKVGLLEAYTNEANFGVVKDESNLPDPISAEMKKGDILIFSSLLCHRSGINTLDKIRWSCHFRYNNLAEETFVDRGYPHAYVYHPISELITPDFPKESDVKKVFS